ncbi:hypothetical protein O7635_14065 [Asanoa sp. WMMD1127]|uniref:hypothetical protein n=1 Tax=Asanoa sp. WMMD1127 TaxID=3016107 RepID=UPI00241659A6|nr:hypothetical protein [Asanoa sp. WMMD1127]MDG4822975.1 hypothetical protein [Asanoa sp. WMMD1127]
MREVSESPEDWQEDEVDGDSLPTVHRRVMLTDLPPSGLADIARRLKLSRPDPLPEAAVRTEPGPDLPNRVESQADRARHAEPDPEPPTVPIPDPRTDPDLLTAADFDHDLGGGVPAEPDPEVAPGTPEPAHRAAEPALEPPPVLSIEPIPPFPPDDPGPWLRTEPDATPEPDADVQPEPQLMLRADPPPDPATGPVLAGLPVAELNELATTLFQRVVDGPADAWRQPAEAELPATEELYDHLCRAEVRRIDAFVYRVDGQKPVVVVRPSTAPAEARTLRRIVRRTDVWIGVPISTVLHPPTDLLDAVYYATDGT